MNTRSGEVWVFAEQEEGKLAEIAFELLGKARELADKLGVPYDRMPSNVVEKYGNSSGTTVPAVIALNLAERLKTESFKVCLSGFGVGLTWGAVSMNLGPVDFCETIEYPNRSK